MILRHFQPLKKLQGQHLKFQYSYFINKEPFFFFCIPRKRYLDTLVAFQDQAEAVQVRQKHLRYFIL